MDSDRVCQLRILFRLVVYSNGLQSSIPSHEAYMYCFDTLPMLTALVLLNVVHPGAVMPGKQSDLPSRKERKRRQAAELRPSESGDNFMLSNQKPDLAAQGHRVLPE